MASEHNRTEEKKTYTVGEIAEMLGISDKVARAAWPADITERPIGSGEGIAALFKEPKNPEDRITRAILHVPEIDTLAGMAKRHPPHPRPRRPPWPRRWKPPRCPAGGLAWSN